jgi:hypothetical protein
MNWLKGKALGNKLMQSRNLPAYNNGDNDPDHMTAYLIEHIDFIMTRHMHECFCLELCGILEGHIRRTMS